MTENEKIANEEAVLSEVKGVMDALTPEQLIQHDIDGAKTPRECRKVSQSAILSAIHASRGRSGLTATEKIEAMQDSRDRLLLAVNALNKGIDIASANLKEN